MTVTTVKELEEAIKKCGDEDNWELLTNTQDIEDIYFGYLLDRREEVTEIGCLFVRWDDEELDTVYCCRSNVPYHHKYVWRLK